MNERNWWQKFDKSAFRGGRGGEIEIRYVWVYVEQWYMNGAFCCLREI